MTITYLDNHAIIPGSQTGIVWVGTPQASKITSYKYTYTDVYPAPYTYKYTTQPGKLGIVQATSAGTKIETQSAFPQAMLPWVCDALGWVDPDSVPANNIGVIKTFFHPILTCYTVPYNQFMVVTNPNLKMPGWDNYTPYFRMVASSDGMIGGIGGPFNPYVQKIVKPSGEAWQWSNAIFKKLDGTYTKVEGVAGAVIAGYPFFRYDESSSAQWPVGTTECWIYSSNFFFTYTPSSYQFMSVINAAEKYVVKSTPNVDSFPTYYTHRLVRVDDGTAETTGVLVGFDGANFLYADPYAYPDGNYEVTDCFIKKPWSTFIMHQETRSYLSTVEKKYTPADNTYRNLFGDFFSLKREDTSGSSTYDFREAVYPVAVKVDTEDFGEVAIQVNDDIPSLLREEAIEGQVLSGLKADAARVLYGDSYNPPYRHAVIPDSFMYASINGVPITNFPRFRQWSMSEDRFSGTVDQAVYSNTNETVYIGQGYCWLNLLRMTDIISAHLVMEDFRFGGAIATYTTLSVRLFKLLWYEAGGYYRWQADGWIPMVRDAVNLQWSVDLKPHMDGVYTEGELGCFAVGHACRYTDGTYPGGNKVVYAGIGNRAYSEYIFAVQTKPLPSIVDIPSVPLPDGSSSLTVTGYVFDDAAKIQKPLFTKTGSAANSTVTSSGLQTTGMTLSMTIKPYFTCGNPITGRWIKQSYSNPTRDYFHIHLIDRDTSTSYSVSSENLGWHKSLQLFAYGQKNSAADIVLTQSFKAFYPRKNLHLSIQHRVNIDTYFSCYQDPSFVAATENFVSDDYGVTWTYLNTTSENFDWVDAIQPA